MHTCRLYCPWQRCPRAGYTRGSGRDKIFVNYVGSGRVENSRNLFFCLVENLSAFFSCMPCLLNFTFLSINDVNTVFWKFNCGRHYEFVRSGRLSILLVIGASDRVGHLAGRVRSGHRKWTYGQPWFTANWIRDCKTRILTCSKAIWQRPCMTRKDESWLSDS